MTTKPLFNPAVSVFPFDSDSKQEMALCEVHRREFTGRYAVPQALVDFLALFNGTRNLEEALSDYQRLHPGKYSTPKLESLVKGFFLPKGLLIDPDKLEPSEPAVPKKKSYLYLRIHLVPASVVNRVTPLVSWLFNQWVFIASLLLIVATHIIFYLVIVPSHPLSLNSLTAPQVISIMILATIPAFIHEWGHASAFTRYGCKNAEIGWGLYLYFFVFYTDVSESWKLNRRQRAMIDVAGIYFQSLSLVLLLLAWWWSKSTILLYCFFIVDLSIAGSLNPFLRMDGYWLMADLFGIANLRQRSLDVMRSALIKLIRPFVAIQTKSSSVNLSNATSIALIAYVVLGSVFFLYLYKIMFYQVVYDLIPSYPQVWVAFWKVFVDPSSSIVQILSQLLEPLWRSIVLLGVAIFVIRAVMTICKHLQKRLHLLTTMISRN